MAISPMRSADEVITYTSRWNIGATGAHVKSTGIPGTGFSGVARDAAGKYTITFQRGIPVGPLVELRITPFHVADEEGYIGRPTQAGFTAETAAAAATHTYESWVVDETAAQTDWPSTAEVAITAVFLKTKHT